MSVLLPNMKALTNVLLTVRSVLLSSSISSNSFIASSFFSSLNSLMAYSAKY